MSDFLLIHGTAHGAWCWGPTIDALAALGHTARAIDLPGCGADRTPAALATLHASAAAILKALTPSTIVVGHSAAGFAITAAAETAAETTTGKATIAALIYLAAYVPQPHQTLADMRRAGPSQPLKGAFRLTPDRTAFTFDPAIATACFYHDCAPDVAAWALAQLTPQPLGPQETALASTAHAATLPRQYIRCTDDRTIPPAYQTRMAQGLPVTDLATGHSPFLSAPAALAQRLSEIANSTLSPARTSG